MNYPYKVIYLETTILQKKWAVKGHLDGLTTAKELEALLLEQDKNGYEVFSIAPMNTNSVGAGAMPVIVSAGFMITFKKKSSS